jgi:tight adherence protein C
VSALLAFAAAACGAAGLVMLVPERSAPRAGERGLGLLLVLAAAGRRVRPAGVPRDLRARIEAAGRPAGLGVREAMAAKLVAAVLLGAGSLPLAALAPGRLGLLVVLSAPVAGFLAPDLWLARVAAERARRVRRELPALLDILRVSVEAGGSLPEALRSVGERSGGPLAREWAAVGREVALGVPLAYALEAMEDRVPLPEIHALVGALERARRHGAPLADTLAAQARAARFALARRIRDDAARAGPKIQLVVALLLVPSVLRFAALGPSQQDTIRWNERSASSPVLLRVTTRTPLTLVATEVTAIWPVPGPEADSSPSVAKYVQLRTSISKIAWYWPSPVLLADVMPRPRTSAPAFEITPWRARPSATPAVLTLPILLALNSFAASERSLIAPPPKPFGLASLPRSVPSLKSRFLIDPLTMSSDPIVAAAYATPLSATKSARQATTIAGEGMRIRFMPPATGPEGRGCGELQEAHQSADSHAGLRPNRVCGRESVPSGGPRPTPRHPPNTAF